MDVHTSEHFHNGLSQCKLSRVTYIQQISKASLLLNVAIFCSLDLHYIYIVFFIGGGRYYVSICEDPYINEENITMKKRLIGKQRKREIQTDRQT